MKIEIFDKNVPSTDGKHTLRGTVYKPEGEIKGLFHIVHGMCDYIGRYDRLMKQIAEAGYLVFGFDNLGHGRTAEKGEHGFIAHKDGWQILAADVNHFGNEMKREYPNLPYYLMGHSMGSFIVRLAACLYPELPDKLIVMGTGGPHPASGAGLLMSRTVKKIRGDKHISPALEKPMFGSYNKRFKDKSGDWLSSDPKVREAYDKDNYCNFHFTASALFDLVMLNSVTNKRSWFTTIRKDLPILLVSGQDDPVGDYGKGVRTVYKKLKAEGANVKIKLYPNNRHEVHNDKARDELKNDILKFISE